MFSIYHSLKKTFQLLLLLQLNFKNWKQAAWNCAFLFSMLDVAQNNKHKRQKGVILICKWLFDMQ